MTFSKTTKKGIALFTMAILVAMLMVACSNPVANDVDGPNRGNQNNKNVGKNWIGVPYTVSVMWNGHNLLDGLDILAEEIPETIPVYIHFKHQNNGTSTHMELYNGDVLLATFENAKKNTQYVWGPVYLDISEGKNDINIELWTMRKQWDPNTYAFFNGFDENGVYNEGPAITINVFDLSEYEAFVTDFEEEYVVDEEGYFQIAMANINNYDLPLTLKVTTLDGVVEYPFDLVGTEDYVYIVDLFTAEEGTYPVAVELWTIIGNTEYSFTVTPPNFTYTVIPDDWDFWGGGDEEGEDEEDGEAIDEGFVIKNNQVFVPISGKIAHYSGHSHYVLWAYPTNGTPFELNHNNQSNTHNNGLNVKGTGVVDGLYQFEFDGITIYWVFEMENGNVVNAYFVDAPEEA